MHVFVLMFEFDSVRVR